VYREKLVNQGEQVHSDKTGKDHHRLVMLFTARIAPRRGHRYGTPTDNAAKRNLLAGNRRIVWLANMEWRENSIALSAFFAAARGCILA
jgi:hypothetical protein